MERAARSDAARVARALRFVRFRPLLSPRRGNDLRVVEHDPELRLILSVSRRLPRPLKVVAKELRKAHLRRPRPPVVSDVGGFRMLLDPADWVDARILFYPQLYDRAEVAFLRRWLRPGDTFLDAGANVGFYSLTAARIVGPSGCVLSVEAAPETAARLRRNIALNGFTNIRVVQLGLSDREETLKLGLNDNGNQGANSFCAVNARRTVDVACRPLTAVLEEAGIQRLDAAKFDIEGFERRVLRRFFADAPTDLYPTLIQVETNWSNFAENTADTLELLASVGYDTVLRTKGNRILQFRGRART
jgi:FkbM family methyltransferase